MLRAWTDVLPAPSKRTTVRTRVWLPSRTEGWPGYYGTVLTTREDGRRVEVQFEERVGRDFSIDELQITG